MMSSQVLSAIPILLLVAFYPPPTFQCGGKSDGEIVSEAQKQNREQELKLWCAENCVGDWQSWSPCSKECAGGIQRRERRKEKPSWCSKYKCRKSTKESRSCNEGCPIAGFPVDGRCSCPSTRGGTCCQNVLECGYPGRPQHGQVEGSWPAMVGSVAIYSCDVGYELSGDIHEQICEKSNNSEAGWTGTKPQCQKLECKLDSRQLNVTQANFLNGVIYNLKAEYAYGEMMVFGCNDGYELFGPETRECVDTPTGAGFSGWIPQCRGKRCEDPGVPLNGRRDGHNLEYRSVISFTCDPGYKRIGSAEIRCLASGQWLGNIPTCEVIECEGTLEVPHARVRVRRRGAAELVAQYTCEEGFEMEDDDEMLCNEWGYWDGELPRCVAINCGDPGTLENGYASSESYFHPSNITYTCYRGFSMRGPATISCLITGVWSTTIPQCFACELNHYEEDGDCIPCMPHSHTLSEASTSPLNCLCDEGYAGEPGQQCNQIMCMELPVPENGVILECNNTYSDKCYFACDDGYIMESGNNIRTCQGNGIWDGSAAFCEPCPVDTYKAGESQCNPCVINSHTDAPGQMLNGCICDGGYQGENGGPCIDVDECAEGRGPCEDECQNLDGSYKCHCNIPGYINDPADQHLCIAEHSCKNLTSEEAPANGGLVCHWYNQMNSQFCSVRCNPHFDHPGDVNNYETCGPATNFQWSFRLNDPNAVLEDCIKEYFAGIRLEADLYYFTSQCDQMSAGEVNSTKVAFANVLNEKGMCSMGETKVCDIKDMGIICGRVTRKRRRRGVEEILQSVDIGFDVTPIEPISSPGDCTQEICQFLHVREEDCERLCIKRFRRFQKAAVMYAEREMNRMFADEEERASMVIHAADRVFEPSEENALTTSGTLVECDPGMASNGESCYSCPAGMYLNTDNETCVTCPAGLHQHMEGQEECNPCTLGTYAPDPGMKECIVCPRGSYGEGCRGRCSCDHGNCDPFVGRCTCLPGWTGSNCDIDKDGCEHAQCAPEVSCHDNPAPEEGYTCGQCPDGYTGDGRQCTPIPSDAVPDPVATSVISHALL